jgi:hypothetical protein
MLHEKLYGIHRKDMYRSAFPVQYEIEEMIDQYPLCSIFINPFLFRGE